MKGYTTKSSASYDGVCDNSAKMEFSIRVEVQGELVDRCEMRTEVRNRE